MGTIFEASFCRLAAARGRGGSKPEGVLDGNDSCGRLLRLEAATGDGLVGVLRGTGNQNVECRPPNHECTDVGYAVYFVTVRLLRIEKMSHTLGLDWAGLCWPALDWIRLG